MYTTVHNAPRYTHLPVPQLSHGHLVVLSGQLYHFPLDVSPLGRLRELVRFHLIEHMQEPSWESRYVQQTDGWEMATTPLLRGVCLSSDNARLPMAAVALSGADLRR